MLNSSSSRMQLVSRMQLASRAAFLFLPRERGAIASVLEFGRGVFAGPHNNLPLLLARRYFVVGEF